jgi:hypothetical protein
MTEAPVRLDEMLRAAEARGNDAKERQVRAALWTLLIMDCSARHDKTISMLLSMYEKPDFLVDLHATLKATIKDYVDFRK